MDTMFIITFHLFFMFFMTFYPFIFKKSIYDYAYIAFSYFILLHWMFLNGECAITYYFKKLENPNYIAGSDLYKDELKSVFKDHVKLIQLFLIIHNLILMLNLFIVSKRNHIHSFFVISFLLLFEVYFYGLYFFKDHYRNPSFLLFQEILKYLTIFIGVGFIYSIRKRFK